MINKKNSLYKILSIMIVFVIVVIMFIYSVYNYTVTKSSLIKELKYNSDTAILQLKNVVAPFIESYSITEYEKIINSYMGYKDIFAIIIEDYKMSEITGNKALFITGKIRNKDWEVINYKPSEESKKAFKRIFYSKSQDIVNSKGIKIGKIYIYSSTHFVNFKLEKIVVHSIVITLLISLLLILALYYILRTFVLKPISDIIGSIKNKDKNAIPIKDLVEFNSLEVSLLSNSINIMLKEIRTSRKNLEELNIKLQNTSNKYQKLMNLSSDMIFITDFDENLLEYSEQVPLKLGYSKEEMKTLKTTDWDKKLTAYENKTLKKKLSNNPVTFETIHTRRDGTTYIAEVSAVKITFDNKDAIYASARDITQRKESEKLIKEQKEEFETIFNYSKDGIAILDLETKFLKFNEAYLNMTGFSKEELLKKSSLDLTAAEDKERTLAVLEEVLKEGSVRNFEKAYLLEDNKRIYVNMSISLLPDKKRFLIVAKDTSSLKLMQEQARLASMGEMVGNIAHQWRQPLSVITTSVSGLKLKSELDCLEKNDISECADSVVTQANYLSKTIDNFRDFIKGDKSYRRISIKETLENTLILLEASLNNNYIKRVIRINDDLEINGNKNELTEGFINIINNSKDVLKQNVKDEDDRLLFIETKKLDENSLELKILDSGGGIDDSIIDRIFEPYFSTKHQSQGTGLGLSMADKIIRNRHKASISVHNEIFKYKNKEYKGACFIIIFKVS
ncbi:PAS domain-containing sensor histidine kinase [Halarcobacter anaerophilus]|uniref:PAS domain-containing sensor histidine kinase n=1 Tax=Halarcobacter anaerophilus TaxID=877500 RepID=UPI000696E2C2|nr:PAS domain-containing sensor histidine kinase [Halarcobacter anaerophilus]